MPVLVEGATESVLSKDVEPRELRRVGDRIGERMKLRCGGLGEAGARYRRSRTRGAQRGEQRPVSPIRSRTGDQTAQDRDLMSQHQDLNLFRGVAPCEEHQPAEQPDHEQIQEARGNER
jgi:hypothetical protein